jgi:hypothetical protein
MKQHLPLIVGISLPFVLIVIVLVAVFLPNMFVNPQYNFVYSNYSHDRYYYENAFKNYYELENGKIVLKPVVNLAEIEKNYPNRILLDAPELFLYDVKNDAARKISLEEANALNLVSGPTSPDGYTVSYRYGHNGIFEIFGSDNDNRGFFISKGNASKKLPALTNFDGRYYYSDANFGVLGWVQ